MARTKKDENIEEVVETEETTPEETTEQDTPEETTEETAPETVKVKLTANVKYGNDLYAVNDVLEIPEEHFKQFRNVAVKVEE